MTNANTAAAHNPSLYDRLGGSVGIAQLVDDIVAAHMANPVIQARFLPYQDDPEKLDRVKGHLRTFLAAGTGGQETYSGRSMPNAHRGMNISEQEYMSAIDDILAAMQKNRIDDTTRKDILAIAYSLKDEILHV